MEINKRLFLILGLVLFIWFLTGNLFAGETFFLGRLGNKKLTFSSYYTSITTKADYKVGGAGIPWEFSHQATIVQSSYRVGAKTNLYGKFGVSESSRKHSGTKTEQWGNFGDGLVYGLGMDYRLKKEAKIFPALNLSFGLTRYHSAMANTTFYGPTGERRVKTKTKVNLNEFQLLVMANKTFGKFTVAAGAQESITTGKDVEEEFLIIAKEGLFGDDFIEATKIGNYEGFYFIPEVLDGEKIEYNADLQKYYPGYRIIGGCVGSFLEARNLLSSVKYELTSNSSLGLELLIGKEMILSFGLTMGF